MAEGLNRVMLLGNLGADPELRFTQGGQAVLHLRLATTESYLDKDKVRRERTDWHSVVVWGKRGEALGKILVKGSSIFIEGSIRTSSYDNREGVKVYKTEVIANNVILAGRGQASAGAPPEDPRDVLLVVAELCDALDQARGGGGGQGGGGYPSGGGYGGQGRGGAAPAARRGAPPEDPPPVDHDDDGGGYGGGDDDIPF